MPQRSITNRYVGPQRRPSINVLKVLEPVRPEERVVYTRLCSRPLRRSLLKAAVTRARASRIVERHHRATSLGGRRPPLIPNVDGAAAVEIAKVLGAGRAHRHVRPQHRSSDDLAGASAIDRRGIAARPRRRRCRLSGYSCSLPTALTPQPHTGGSTKHGRVPGAARRIAVLHATLCRSRWCYCPASPFLLSLAEGGGSIKFRPGNDVTSAVAGRATGMGFC